MVPTSSGGISLTPLQAAKSQQELEREEVEREAQKLRKLEVCCDPTSSGRMTF